MNNIDIEKDEYLTELLTNLYEKWKSCINMCGTDSEREDAFFDGVRRHLEKGFSILNKPGIYHAEDVLESLSNDLYEKWKDYVHAMIKDMGADDDDFDLSVNAFITIARDQLDYINKKKDPNTSWQDTDNKSDD